MGKIAILSKQRAGDNPQRQRLAERSMPVDYMGDFSILGVLVDRLPDAIRLLEKHRFDITTENRCAEVVTDDLAQMRNLFRVLEDGGFDYGFADVADRIYQG